MLEKDLESLKTLVSATPLEGLEGQVWRRVAADEAMVRMNRLILACQAGVVVMFIAGGALSALALRSPQPALDAFSLERLPAPSTLLLGHST
ncbi:MAG: hypothetical protein LCH56_09385 [Proteobacteria bacterium]|nr:hypothetical protein [Pseudomonadota bacterium]